MFSDEVIRQAWERSSGQCECRRRTHSHFYVPCGKALDWAKRAEDTRGGWQAHALHVSGGESLANCEILCIDCYQSSSY